MKFVDIKIAYDNASMREADTEQELRKAKQIGKIEGKIEGQMEEKQTGITKALKRGKLTIEEIAEDFETTVDFVLHIKTAHQL